MLHGVCFKAVLILPDDGILGELNSPAVRPWSAAVLLAMCLFFFKTPLPRHCSVIVTNMQVMSRYSPIRVFLYRAHSALADEQLHSPVKVVFSASLLWCFSAVEHFGATQSKVPKWLSARARGLGSATRGLINSSLPNNRVYRYDNSAWTSRGCKKKNWSICPKQPIEDECWEKLLFWLLSFLPWGSLKASTNTQWELALN